MPTAPDADQMQEIRTAREKNKPLRSCLVRTHCMGKGLSGSSGLSRLSTKTELTIFQTFGVGDRSNIFEKIIDLSSGLSPLLGLLAGDSTRQVQEEISVLHVVLPPLAVPIVSGGDAAELGDHIITACGMCLVVLGTLTTRSNIRRPSQVF